MWQHFIAGQRYIYMPTTKRKHKEQMNLGRQKPIKPSPKIVKSWLHKQRQRKQKQKEQGKKGNIAGQVWAHCRDPPIHSGGRAPQAAFGRTGIFISLPPPQAAFGPTGIVNSPTLIRLGRQKKNPGTSTAIPFPPRRLIIPIAMHLHLIILG